MQKTFTSKTDNKGTGGQSKAAQPLPKASSSAAEQPRRLSALLEATVAERGQITLPKTVRDALGLSKGSKLVVELEGGRIVLRKNVDDAMSRVRGLIKLPPGQSTDDVMRVLRGRAPGEPLPRWDQPAPPPAAAAAPGHTPAAAKTSRRRKAP